MCLTQPYNRASQRTSLPSWAWVGHAAVQLAGSTHRPHSKAQVAWKDLSQSPWLQSIHMPGFPHKQQVYRCAEGAELEGRRRGMQVTYDCGIPACCHGDMHLQEAILHRAHASTWGGEDNLCAL